MESLECLVKFWKRFETVRVTADALVCRLPCFLSSVVIKGDGSGSMEVDVHNGHDTSGEVKVSMRDSALSSKQFSFNPPMYFSQGLYLEARSNMVEAGIQFMVEPD